MQTPSLASNCSMDSPSTFAAYVNTTTTSLGGLNLNLDPDHLEPSRTGSDQTISLQQPAAGNQQSFLKQDHEAEDLAEKLRKMTEENKKLTEKLSAMYEDFNIIKRFFKKYLMTMMMNNSSCNNNKNDDDDDDRQQQISTQENQNDDQQESMTINLRKRKAAESMGSYLCSHSTCHHDHHQDAQSRRRHHLITSTSTDQGPNNYACSWTRSSPRLVTINKPNVSKVYVRIQKSDTTLAVQDGYQWRKYGQKVTRDNPSPRAYFKCSFAPLCPVKKKVQRSAEDPQMLVATYEGEHDHRIPPSLGSNVHILPPVTSTVSPDHHHGPSTAGIFSSNPDPLTSGPAASITNSIMTAHEHHPASSVSTTVGTENLEYLNQRIRTTLKECGQENGQPPPSQRSLLVEQMAASLTSDPSFTAALAASISRTMLENSRAAELRWL